jgi:hypothetical protein
MPRTTCILKLSLLANVLMVSVPAQAVSWEWLTPSFPGGNERDLGLQIGLGDPLRHTGTLSLLPENVYSDGWSMFENGSFGQGGNARITYDHRASVLVAPALPAGDESPATPASAQLGMSSYLLGSVNNGPQDVLMRNNAFTGPAKVNTTVVQAFKLQADQGESLGSPVMVNYSALFQFGVSAGASTKMAGSGSLHGPTGASLFTVEHNGTALLSHGADPDAGYAWGDAGSVLARIGDTFAIAASVSAWLSVLHEDFSIGYQSAGFSPSLNVTLQAEPVPEPETWAMLLAGLGLTCLRLRAARRIGRPSLKSAYEIRM